MQNPRHHAQLHIWLTLASSFLFADPTSLCSVLSPQSSPLFHLTLSLHPVPLSCIDTVALGSF